MKLDDFPDLETLLGEDQAFEAAKTEVLDGKDISILTSEVDKLQSNPSQTNENQNQ